MKFKGKQFCDGIRGVCGNLLEIDEEISKELCMFCQGFHKEPLGPIDRPFLTYNWVK